MRRSSETYRLALSRGIESHWLIAPMDAYQSESAPPAVGLVNVGATCYINALLQTLASCTAFTRAAEAHRALMAGTRTGRAILGYFSSLGLVPPPTWEGDPTRGSEAVLAALVADLAERRPGVKFGAGQESASEVLVHLLDMLEPPDLASRSPVTDLFLHRYTCTVHCRSCSRASAERDHAVQVNLFHFDGIAPPRTPQDFARALSRQVSEVEDYRCESCQRSGRALRVYALTMVPEILCCVFNLYDGYGGAHRPRWFPERFALPGRAGGELLQYRLVSQLEHSGTLSGGHYWARCLRRGGVYTLNDMSVVPSAFAPSAQTYMVIYHYECTLWSRQGEWEALVRARPGAQPA